MSIQAIFDDAGNFVAVRRAPDTAAGEVARQVAADDYDAAVAPGYGHWDATASRIVVGPVPPASDLDALQALTALHEQIAAWRRELVLTSAEIAAGGFAQLDSAEQAIRRIWTDAIGADGTGSVSLPVKAVIFRAAAMGATDIVDVPAFLAAADQFRAVRPTSANLWVDEAGTRLALAAAHNYGPLTATWKNYDRSWAVSRTHETPS